MTDSPPAPSLLRKTAAFAVVACALLGGGAGTIALWPHLRAADRPIGYYPADIDQQVSQISSQLTSFQDAQARANIQIVDPVVVQASLTAIELNVTTHQFGEARKLLASLKQQTKVWSASLTQRTMKPGAPATVAGGLSVPILLYHDPPTNLREQFEYLKTHGYTVVTLDQIADALDGTAALPIKPVALTFDDGFADQLSAVDLLKSFRFPATFYIINGGEASRWCIGASRRYNDPLQPPGGCGDSYLNWTQIKQIDRGGLITIGVHTVDHENLAGESLERQRFEILQSKTDIERELGHPVVHFCYPYGSYDNTSIAVVSEAGFRTATTTLPGTIQPPGSRYTLRRIRDTLSLP